LGVVKSSFDGVHNEFFFLGTVFIQFHNPVPGSDVMGDVPNTSIGSTIYQVSAGVRLSKCLNDTSDLGKSRVPVVL
jgi:hypothetical protein